MVKEGKFELVIVNCDKREKEYAEHLKSMDWCLALPFDADDEKIQKLEEGCNANVIPRLSIYGVSKGFEKPVVADIKQVIIKMGDANNDISPADAV